MMVFIAAGATNIDTTRNGSEKIPAKLTGKWLNGTFSMSNW
jgi:hypothetical protein